MKITLTFIIICVLVSQSIAQCYKYVQAATDKMTSKEYVIGKSLIVSSDGNRTGFKFTPYFSEGRVLFAFKFAGENCIDNSNSIYILFTDQSRLQLKNHTSFNCDNEGIVYFSPGNRNISDLTELTEKKIETIRVYTYKSYVQSDFTISQANLFQRVMYCLKEAGGEDFVATFENSLSSGNFKSLGMLNSKALKLGKPIYPDEARKLKAKGVVFVDVIIDEEGKVIYAKAVTGNDSLKKAAEDAAKESVFPPTEEAGQKVKGKGIISYSFMGIF